MNDSPLLYLCSDVSDVIGEYLDTYKKNHKMKQELNSKIERSMVKCFNIQCLELKFHEYIEKHDGFLYKIHEGGWVWKGKRINESTRTFYIQCVSPNEGLWRGLKLLLFPSELKSLNKLGYYDVKVLLKEL